MEILKCPKCGSDVLVIDHYSVACVDCFFAGPENSNEEIRSFGGYNEACYDSALEKWNSIERQKSLSS